MRNVRQNGPLMRSMAILGFIVSLSGSGREPVASAPSTPPSQADAMRELRLVAERSGT